MTDNSFSARGPTGYFPKRAEVAAGYSSGPVGGHSGRGMRGGGVGGGGGGGGGGGAGGVGREEGRTSKHNLF